MSLFKLKFVKYVYIKYIDRQQQKNIAKYHNPCKIEALFI